MCKLDKFAIYYSSRVWFYQFLYGLLCLIVSAVVGLILSFIVVYITDFKGHGGLSGITQSEGAQFLFIGFYVLFLVLCMLVLTYFYIKWSLNKMFFKPYKKFVITTEIERITPKMVFIFWGMEFLLTFIVEFLIELMFLKDLAQTLESSGNIAKYILILSSIGLIVGSCVTYVVSQYFVHKYATVTSKESVLQ